MRYKITTRCARGVTDDKNAAAATFKRFYRRRATLIVNEICFKDALLLAHLRAAPSFVRLYLLVGILLGV